MNPNWVIVRPHRAAIAPLKRGAAEVLSYGLHARRTNRMLWKVALSHPDDTIETMVCVDAALTPTILDALAKLALKKTDKRQVVVWVHGLAESIVELFGTFKQAFSCSTEPVVVSDDGVRVQWQGYHQTAPRRVELLTATRDLDADLDGWELPSFRLSLLRGPTGAATLTYHNRRTIRLLDSQSYVKADLGSAECRGLLAHATRAREQGLHAIHPATATRVLGERIADVWTLLDTQPAPTPASTGAKLFRRRYLTYPLQRVPYHVESAAELAFHGGKVGLWCQPKSRFPRVYVYDLRSAYGAAMRLIPSFYSGEWVTTRGTSSPTTLSLLPGFSRVSGTVRTCQWPIIANHSGEWQRGVSVKKVWITNYEFQEAVNSGELDAEEWVSWCWIERGAASSPWKAFSEEVFAQRDACTDALRDVYKGGLVGLYGKTVQRSAIPPVPPDGTHFEYGVPITYCNRGNPDDKRPQYFRAGGFYYPVVGSLVTGLVRSWMHKIEHAYEAVHSAVDAVHTLRPLPDELLTPGLGGWRYVGVGAATYHAANHYTIVGPNGWRKRAAAGVPAGTLDQEQEVAL